MLRGITLISSLFFSQVSYANQQLDYIIPYNQLLSMHVSSVNGASQTLVNYTEWKNNKLHKQAMRSLQQVNPKELLDKEKMVFWINAYNLLTIDLIIKEDEKESIRNTGMLFINPWTWHKWKIGNKKYSLDTIEHKILRKMGEPRIHMAIVCASISCPNLRNEAYTVEKLEEQLTKQTNHFLASETKGVRQIKGGLMVSPIFKWFKEDFKSGISHFIAQHRKDIDKRAPIIDYLKYNWSLNAKK